MSVLKKLQEVETLEAFADLLGYTPSGLAYILYKIPSRAKYNKFSIPKKNGGVREINAPTDKLKQLQARLANILYACRYEIEANNPKLKPLSHAYRAGLSIVTNAKPHKNRRYVLNIDLENFFPSINFGRVRGFFIKDKDFSLSAAAATIIAQIACYENELPQGSPCSPIISDLLARVLDRRLARLARKNRIAYSRYADDLTFSTNEKDFPSALAATDATGAWVLGADLRGQIVRSGFSINEKKTRMQLGSSRQTVTGLTVNRNVNVPSNYYKNARAMTETLFRTGEFHIDGTKSDSLDRLHGILNYNYYVKHVCRVQRKNETENVKSKDLRGIRSVYSKFLRYKYFVALKRPLIICEGKTDNSHLRYAIRNLKKFHPALGEISAIGHFSLNISLFSFDKIHNDLFNLNGGSAPLKDFIVNYERDLKPYTHRPFAAPVIILIDNDSGAKEIFGVINSKFKKNNFFGYD